MNTIEKHPLFSKLFLKVNFFLILSVLIFLSGYILILRKKNNLLSFELSKNVNYVFLGHSHSSSAYNDSIIDHSKNISEGGEAYIYTYFKLKNLIKDNKRKDLIYFIEFSNNQIDSSMNRWFFKEPFISDKLPRYSTIIDFKGYSTLIINNPVDVINSMFLSFNLNLKDIEEHKTNVINTLGGFSSKNRSLIKEDVTPKINLTRENLDSKNYNVSNTSIFYFKKIISLLNKSKVNFFIIRTPIHYESEFRKNEKTYQKIITDLNIRNKYIDLGNLFLPNKFYYDHLHLNIDGANFYSKLFNKLLKHNKIDVDLFQDSLFKIDYNEN
jgi:hypothetical protein